MARIVSFSVPEDWKFTEEVMDMSSSGIREAIEERLKILSCGERRNQRLQKEEVKNENY